MPLFNETDITPSAIKYQGTTESESPEIQELKTTEDADKPKWIETARAFFKLHDPIFNIFRKTIDPEYPNERTDLNYDSLDDIHGYEEHADRFIDSNNWQNTELIKQRIDWEREQQAILDKSPTWAKITGGLAAAIADPLILIPGIGQLTAISKVGKIAQGIGQGAAIGTAIGVTRESILQATQETRELSDSAIAVLAEGALGGLLGGLVGGLSRGTRQGATEVLGDALKGTQKPVDIDNGSVGAAQTATGEGDKLAKINEGLTRILTGPDALKPPSVRGLLSESGVVRAFTNKTFLHNYLTKKNMQGIATENVAEKLINRDMAQLKRIMEEADGLYLKYTGKSRLSAAFGPGKGKIKLDEFEARVSKALNDEKYKDVIPEVNEAAKLHRTLMDKQALGMKEVRIFKDLDVKAMRNYLSRIFDLNTLQKPSVQQNFVRDFGARLRTHKKDGTLRPQKISQERAEDLAANILDKIRREQDEYNAFATFSEQTISTGKFTKSRSLQVPYELVEPYVLKNTRDIVSNYVYRSSAMIHSQRAIQDLGFENFAELKNAIKLEKRQAIAGKSDKQAEKIAKKFDKAEEDAELIYRSITNNLSKPGKADRFFQTLRNYQFMRLLGGVTISSLPELMMAPFRLGFINTLRDGWLPAIRSFKTAKMAKDQLRDLDVGFESGQDSILRMMADNTDPTGRPKNAWDRSWDAAGNFFAHATGIQWWTSSLRRMTGQVAAAGLIRKIQSGKITQKEMAEMASIGIDKSRIPALKKQIDKYAEEVNGSYMMNLHLWDDEGAKKAMSDAVQTQVESSILKPGKGDLPFAVQSSQAIKMLFQFKAFMSGATGKITISGLQRRDARALQGLFALIFMGMMTAVIKDKMAGRETSDDPVELLIDGISRSGVAGLIGTTAIDIGLNLWNDKTRRFGGNLASALLGPSVSQAFQAEDLLGRLTTGRLTDKEIKAALQMLPFANLFYIKAATDQVFKEK